MDFRSSSGRCAHTRHPAEDHPQVLIIALDLARVVDGASGVRERAQRCLDLVGVCRRILECGHGASFSIWLRTRCARSAAGVHSTSLGSGRGKVRQRGEASSTGTRSDGRGQAWPGGAFPFNCDESGHRRPLGRPRPARVRSWWLDDRRCPPRSTTSSRRAVGLRRPRHAPARVLLVGGHRP